MTPPPPLSVPSRERRDRAIRAEAPHFLCPAREQKALSCCFSISPSRGVFELGLAGEVVGASEEGERLGAAIAHLAHPPASSPVDSKRFSQPCTCTSGLAPKREALVFFTIIILISAIFMFFVRST